MEEGTLNKWFSLSNIAKSILGAIGFFATILGIISYFEDKSVKIEYQIISNTNVFDLNANLSKLDITYDKSSLKSLKENLRIVNIRIKNTGNQDILKGFYDDKEPLGLTVNYGKIIELPDLIYASNSYLKKNAKPILINPQTINFQNVIIEKSEYFTIKLLILHPINKLPLISSIGKIAGLNSILVVNNLSSTNETPFFNKIYDGDIFVQLLRFILYSVIFMIAVILYFLFYDQFNKTLVVRKREKFIKSLNYFPSYIRNDNSQAAHKLYIKIGKKELFRVNSLLKNENSLNKMYQQTQKVTHNTSGNVSIITSIPLNGELFKNLISLSIVRLEDNIVKVNEGYGQSIAQLTENVRNLDFD